MSIPGLDIMSQAIPSQEVCKIVLLIAVSVLLRHTWGKETTSEDTQSRFYRFVTVCSCRTCYCQPKNAKIKFEDRKILAHQSKPGVPALGDLLGAPGGREPVHVHVLAGVHRLQVSRVREA